MRFSASRLKAHMACSLAAHYRYDANLPRRQNAKASFGTIVHRCLQTYNDTGSLDLAVDQFKDLWANPEKAGCAPDYWPKLTSYSSLRAKGLDILRDFHERQRWQTRTVVGTEIPFLVPFGAYELTGFIDLLEVKRSGTGAELLRVVDLKTNTLSPNRAELALDVQFTVYHYASHQPAFWVGVDGDPQFPGLPNGQWLWETVGSCMTRRCIWYHLWSQKEIDAGPRTETDYGRLYRVCEQVERSIDAQVFVPTIGAPCQLCDYVEPCAMEVPVAIDALGDRSDPHRWI